MIDSQLNDGWFLMVVNPNRVLRYVLYLTKLMVFYHRVMPPTEYSRVCSSH